VKITGEEATFRFVADAGVYFPKEESFFSQQRAAVQSGCKLGTLKPADLGSIPALVETPVGPKVANRRSGSGGLPRPLAARHRWPGADRDVSP